uniref:Uncharacterized protein n=1 Tax=Sphaerodactylus townsendi TaxID=933632 RepID=A0ACB8EF77_9SAUR
MRNRSVALPGVHAHVPLGKQRKKIPSLMPIFTNLFIFICFILLGNFETYSPTPRQNQYKCKQNSKRSYRHRILLTNPDILNGPIFSQPAKRSPQPEQPPATSNRLN